MDAPQRMFGRQKNTIIKQKVAPQNTIMRSFLKPSARCLGCNCAVPLSPASLKDPSAKEIALCDACAPMRSQLCKSMDMTVEQLRHRSAELWQKCDACAGGESMAKMCRNAHCETFYDRYMVHSSLSSKEAARQRLDW